MTILFSIIGGLLGAYSGATNTSKLWRKIGLPVLYFLYSYFHIYNLWILSLFAIIYCLSIGYGIPDNTDEGSTLGRFYWNLFQNSFLTNFFTRGTIGLGCVLSCLSIPIINHKWLLYIICSIIVILLWALIGWRNLKTIKIFNKDLCISDIIVYTGMTYCIFKMI